MTICSKMYEALDKRLEEKKSLDEIGAELCDAVVDPRGKAIRLIKSLKCTCKKDPCRCHNGEKFLKENSGWLGYQPENVHNQYTGKKNSAELELYEDARSNGLRVDYSPPLPQREFMPDEVVYERLSDIDQDNEQIPQCKIFVPSKQDIRICPCGNHGYCEINEKWYSINEINNMKEV